MLGATTPVLLVAAALPSPAAELGTAALVLLAFPNFRATAPVLLVAEALLPSLQPNLGP